MLFTTLILLLLCGLPPCFTSKDESLVISLDQGKIQGKRDISTKGEQFFSFLGVPYAKPPVGTLRFMKPEPPERWEGVRNGTLYPSECSHLDLLKVMKEWKAGYLGNEDCLIVNVHTPRIDGKQNLPVMVYFHGGAFVFGGHELYEPHELLNENVVLVVVQYRLGALGFLSTEDGVIPANQGLRDQTMALRWVNENIASFSGDVNKITIFGNSAGGASVHAHILSDYSNGLFSRAILQSGTLLCPWARMANPKKVAITLGDHFDCFKDTHDLDGNQRSHHLLKCLQNVEAEILQLATHQLFEWSFLPANTVPYMDGDYFSDDFETLLKKGNQKAVDVIYGVTKDEGSFVSCPWLVMDDQRKAIKDDFSNIGPISLGLENEEDAVEISRAVYDFYVGGVKNDVEDYQNLNRMYGHRHFSICSDITALFHAEKNKKAGKKTFYYELHHRGLRSISNIWGDPPATRYWIAHADDIFYLFPVTSLFAVNRDIEDQKMRDLFTKMWVNFADNGNPTPDGTLGFQWDPFTPEDPKHLKITMNPIMENDLRKKEREFWNSLPTKQNKLLFAEIGESNIKEEL